MTSGPAGVQRRIRSYVTPGISCVGRAEAAGARTNARMTAKRSLRRIRPRITLAEATAIFVVVVFLFTSGAGNAASARRDSPVPILMYHVIADPPAGTS